MTRRLQGGNKMIHRNRDWPTLLSAVAVATLAGSWSVGAMAQEPREGESVFQRARPDYDPLGVRAGSFVIFPQIEIGESYDDNIFADKNDEDDDFITVVAPQATAESDWGRHALNLSAGALAGFYLDHNDEDYIDGFATADGRLDVVRGTQLLGGLGWRHLHEDRGSPDSPTNAKEPVEYENLFASVGAVRSLGRISARIDGILDRLEFHDVDANGGGHIEEDDRDRTQYSLIGRVGYEYLPNTDAFVQVTGRFREYDELNAAGEDRSSQGYAAVVGTELNFTPKVTGEVFAGYQYTTYDDEAFDDVASPALGGNVLWNVTGLTSIRGFAEGSIEETTQADASSYLAVRIGGSVEHELRRNILLGAGLTFGRDDYEGISRTDDVFIGLLSARYLINRNFYARAAFTHTTRTSDTDDEYSRNVILLTLGAQL